MFRKSAGPRACKTRTDDCKTTTCSRFFTHWDKSMRGPHTYIIYPPNIPMCGYPPIITPPNTSYQYIEKIDTRNGEGVEQTGEKCMVGRENGVRGGRGSGAVGWRESVMVREGGGGAGGRQRARRTCTPTQNMAGRQPESTLINFDQL